MLASFMLWPMTSGTSAASRRGRRLERVVRERRAPDDRPNRPKRPAGAVAPFHLGERHALGLQQPDDRDVRQLVEGGRRQSEVMYDAVGQLRGHIRLDRLHVRPALHYCPVEKALCPGMASSVDTFNAPPENPKIVTFDGSPPNEAMLSLIDSNVATMSSTPAIPEFS